MEINDVDITLYQKNGFSVLQYGVNLVEKVLPYFSVAQSVEGSYSFGAGKAPMERAGQGGFFIAPSGVRQRILQEPDPATKRMTCRWVFIIVRVNGSYTMDQLFDFPPVIETHLAAEMNGIFNDIFGAEDIFDERAALFRMLKLLFSLAREKKAPLTSPMQSTSDYIEAHLADDISVEELAANVHLSVSGFHAAFRRYFDLPPLRYINYLRLAKAAGQLLNTDLPVAKIGEEVGIRDAFYFSRAFKKQYGMAPRQYRETLRARAE